MLLLLLWAQSSAVPLRSLQDGELQFMLVEGLYHGADTLQLFRLRLSLGASV